ncbi:MAG TPA: hypothetical protein DCS43_15960 [Verrucomicrobia bacterium]|nr:hypothetical protein [Verrucomicrobiota bacterium]
MTEALVHASLCELCKASSGQGSQSVQSGRLKVDKSSGLGTRFSVLSVQRKVRMMSKMLVVPFLVAIVLMLCDGCATENGVTETKGGIPAKLDLPADFKATKADWVDNDRSSVGWPLGIRTLRGKAIKPRNGVFPVHVMKAPIGEFDGDPIQVDDLLIGINGKPLLGKPEEQFMREWKRAEIREASSISVTLWNKGEIKTVTLDISVKIPDLVKGDKPTDLHDWQLGPTGLNGWLYSEATLKGASHDARQLLITRVEDGSAAAGKAELGDIIIGVDGRRFESDARRVLAKAIVAAEKKANEGRLNLLVYRKGKEMDLSITLAVMPDSSATSPYDCPKTDMIIENAVRHIKDNKDSLLKPGEWLGYINGLGLLASGRDDLMPIVRDLAHASLLKNAEKLSIEKHMSMGCWQWSYKTVFLCEYYLRTGDKAVLPTIEEYATKIAMGQSGVGTWGHAFAAIENEGRLHGRLGGYGAINQQGLTLMIALLLAQKCGIDNKEITDAIRRGDVFFSYYIGKGGIPYGDHEAYIEWFDDNGKSGSAAIMFEFMGKPEGAKFFSEMILGSATSGREMGHTGCFWSHLWGGVGAARSGKDGMVAFMREMDWAFTLERHQSGRFSFQGNAGEAGESGEAKTRWDSTGARLLQLCAQRKEIYLTGKGSSEVGATYKERIERIIADGRLATDKSARMALTESEIIRLLGDELPPIRNIASRAIFEQELNCAGKLVQMLDSPNKYARYGACYALKEGGYGSRAAIDRLIEVIKNSDDLNLRLWAMDALIGDDPEMGLAYASKDAIPVLLKLAVKHFDMDPRRLMQRRIANVLFREYLPYQPHGLITMHGIDGLDDADLVAAIRELLTVDDGHARTMVSTVYPMLSKSQKDVLWGDIYRATRDIAPSGIMFADGVRLNGLKLMQAEGIEEGIQLAVDFMSEARWGAGQRENGGIDVLKGYGGNAKLALPLLRDLEKKQVSAKKPDDKGLEKLREAVKSIEEGAPVKLNTISEHIKSVDNK